MKILPTESFKRDYQKLSKEVKTRVEKTLQLLIADLSHPSLKAKKIKSREDIWEVRVTKDRRLTFQIAHDIYILRRIGKHDEVLRRP